mmetsp:Transcript_11920/g.25166  ORF Transcript_11920/g.25166 Transcript_11920/m.25166 type:complete len:205 (-) Transcript_11920:1249-1863(-)
MAAEDGGERAGVRPQLRLAHSGEEGCGPVHVARPHVCVDERCVHDDVGLNLRRAGSLEPALCCHEVSLPCVSADQRGVEEDIGLQSCTHSLLEPSACSLQVAQPYIRTDESGVEEDVGLQACGDGLLEPTLRVCGGVLFRRCSDQGYEGCGVGLCARFAGPSKPTLRRDQVALTCCAANECVEHDISGHVTSRPCAFAPSLGSC